MLRRPFAPIMRVEMRAGSTLDRKRERVEVLSKKTARVTGGGVESVYIVIEDERKENRGADGRFCSEKFPDQSGAVPALSRKRRPCRELQKAETIHNGLKGLPIPVHKTNPL
jgi:4-oxalocrotonate tautomerase